MEVGQAGYGKTRREIITLAENVVCDKGMLRGSRVTSGWFRRFMERHPDMSIRKGDVTELIKKQKEEEKAKKAAERDSRAKKRAPRSTNKSYVDKRSPNASSPGSAPRAKRKKPVSRDSDIDINQCCVCFQTFEDDEREQSGLEWVECACSRWLHKECIEYDLSVNSRGQELLCLFCCFRLSLLSNYVEKYKILLSFVKKKF